MTGKAFNPPQSINLLIISSKRHRSYSCCSPAIQSLIMGNTRHVRLLVFAYRRMRESKLRSSSQCGGRTKRGKKCSQRPKSNGFCFQHQQHIRKSFVTTKPSEDPTFLNSRSLQAVIAMSTFLDANTPDNQGLPPSHPPSYVGADLDPGFDIDTTGLTSGIHMELAKVGTILTSLPKLQIHTSLL